MGTMGAGLLRQRVTFQRRSLDENGDPLGDWADSQTVWARVRPSRGTEEVLQARQQGVEVVDITVRVSAATRALTSAWRAVWDGRPFNLGAPLRDEANAFITVTGRSDQSDA